MPSQLSSRQCLLAETKRNGWDEAIADAEAMLGEAQAKVQQLTEAIRIFKRRRDKGEPFFGQSQEQSEATGQ